MASNILIETCHRLLECLPNSLSDAKLAKPSTLGNLNNFTTTSRSFDVLAPILRDYFDCVSWKDLLSSRSVSGFRTKFEINAVLSCLQMSLETYSEHHAGVPGTATVIEIHGWMVAICERLQEMIDKNDTTKGDRSSPSEFGTANTVENVAPSISSTTQVGGPSSQSRHTTPAHIFQIPHSPQSNRKVNQRELSLDFATAREPPVKRKKTLSHTDVPFPSLSDIQRHPSTHSTNARSSQKFIRTLRQAHCIVRDPDLSFEYVSHWPDLPPPITLEEFPDFMRDHQTHFLRKDNFPWKNQSPISSIVECQLIDRRTYDDPICTTLTTEHEVILFLQFDRNFVPSTAGQHLVIFSHWIIHKLRTYYRQLTWNVFVKRFNQKTSWEYCGIYQAVDVGSVTEEDMNRLPDQFVTLQAGEIQKAAKREPDWWVDDLMYAVCVCVGFDEALLQFCWHSLEV